MAVAIKNKPMKKTNKPAKGEPLKATDLMNAWEKLRAVRDGGFNFDYVPYYYTPPQENAIPEDTPKEFPCEYCKQVFLVETVKDCRTCPYCDGKWWPDGVTNP